MRTRGLSLSCAVLNPSERSAAPNPSKNPLNALHHPAKLLHTPLSLPPPPPSPRQPPQRARRCKITLPAPGARRRMTPDFSTKLFRAALEHLEPLQRAPECLCVLGDASNALRALRTTPDDFPLLRAPPSGPKLLRNIAERLENTSVALSTTPHPSKLL